MRGNSNIIGENSTIYKNPRQFSSLRKMKVAAGFAFSALADKAFHVLGLLEDSNQRNKAITKFCFENTELQRLWAEVDVRNIPSQKMLEKCGYTREGLIRQGKMVNTWCDYYIYGMLASDYFNSGLPV